MAPNNRRGGLGAGSDGGTPMPERVPSPRSLPTRAPPDAEPMATQDGGLPGLGRLRASLLDSLRAERSKLERERALLDRQ